MYEAWLQLVLFWCTA